MIAAVCRHGCPITGCNLIKSGERYAYLNYVLTQHLLRDENCKFAYIDIACRYNAWANRCCCARIAAELLMLEQFRAAAAHAVHTLVSPSTRC